MSENKKLVKAWCMYDWANSVYNLVINTAIFPIYYTGVTALVAIDGKINVFGFEAAGSVVYSYALSFSYLLAAVILPILSGVADYTGQKKRYLIFFTSLGTIACMGMYFFTSSTLEWGIICMVIACFGYSSSLVFYDAYLPEIASEESTDRVSAKGYAYGYAGSALMMIGSLIIITYFDSLGFSNKGEATRFVFLLVGLWWIGWAIVPFRRLPSNIYNRKPTGKILLNGYKEILMVFRQLRDLKNMKMYLLAFFFFNMGVKTVMLLATLFGANELHLDGSQLIPILLIIQFVAVFGSMLFAILSEKKGNIFSLSLMIIVWIGVCIYAYFMTEVYQFYIIAVIVGLVMGGIQALSRATFSKLIPEDSEDHTSFFSFFDVAFHLSIVAGTFSYGLIDQITGNMRFSTLALTLFFLLGILFLSKVKLHEPKLAKA